MIIIKEFLPNPLGNDKDGEYIKIFNDGNQQVSIAGWRVKNLSGKTYNLSGELGAQKELVLPYLKTKIALSNNGETVFLYNEKGILIDKLGYAGGTGLKIGEIVRKNQQLPINNLQTDYPINFPAVNQIATKFFLADFLIAIILAAIILYIILQIEKKLGIKLF